MSYSKEKFNKIEKKLQNVAKDYPELSPRDLLEKAQISIEAFDPLVSKTELLDKNSNQIYIFEDSKQRALRDEGMNPVHAIKLDGKLQLIDQNHEVIESDPQIPKSFKPVAVEVIGKAKVAIQKDGSLEITKIKPITADIDILAYGAKINLHEFDKITSYSKIVQKEKETAIAKTSLDLPASLNDALIKEEIDKAEVPSYLEFNQEFLKLQSELKNIELLRENLKGMGDGSDTAMAITGHMRSEFKEQEEMSHGAEQFNIYSILSPRFEGRHCLVRLLIIVLTRHSYSNLN